MLTYHLVPLSNPVRPISKERLITLIVAANLRLSGRLPKLTTLKIAVPRAILWLFHTYTIAFAIFMQTRKGSTAESGTLR